MTNTLQTALLRMTYPERYGGGEVGPLAAAEAESDFGLIERTLDGRDWLVGDHRTAADLFLFMLTRWGRHLDPPAWDRPAIRAHFLRTLALPGVRRMIGEQGLEFPLGPTDRRVAAVGSRDNDGPSNRGSEWRCTGFRVIR